MFIESIQVLVRTLIIGIIAYAAIVVILRITGKRTLSKWNAFDFIVTVALGSSLATSILSRQVSLAQGVLVFALLTVLQFIVTWVSVRSDTLQHLIKSSPALLLHEGEFQRETMLRERVTEEEVRAALRSQGIAAVESVAAVVLETDGSFSVIKEWEGRSRTALSGVTGLDTRCGGP